MIKKCYTFREDPTSICFQCMFYFCDYCFKNRHSKEDTKNNKKEKIDYYLTFEVRCHKHELIPMNLFCVNEKGKLLRNLIIIL